MSGESMKTRAEHHDDARPFHHGAETADREIDEMRAREGEAAHPDVGEQDEVGLDEDAEEVFEKKREPDDDGRPLKPDADGLRAEAREAAARRRAAA